MGTALILIFFLGLVCFVGGFMTISKFTITEQAIRIWDRGLDKGESKDQITSEVSDFFAKYGEKDLKLAFGSKFKNFQYDKSSLKKYLNGAKVRSIIFICYGIVCIVLLFWGWELADFRSSESPLSPEEKLAQKWGELQESIESGETRVINRVI